MLRAAAFAATFVLAACSSEPPPEPRETQAEAREKAKQGPMGEPIKALDKAATVQDTVDQQGKAVTDAVDEQAGDAPATTPPP